MSIISFTGHNINDTIKQKLSIKEKRYISSRTIIYLNSNDMYTKRLKIVFKILINFNISSVMQIHMDREVFLLVSYENI